MYDQLKSRLALKLQRPRALKPQTERQLAQHLSEHHSNLSTFLVCAPDILQEHELDIVFGPLFTPTIDERAELADLLYHWRPSVDELQQLVTDLCAAVPQATILLPDGTKAPLAMHEVMIDRFVRLLRLEHAADAAIAASLRDAIPSDLWNIGTAVMCERGITAVHQKWLVNFLVHVSSRRTVTRAMLESIVNFVASQQKLDRASLSAAAEGLMRATQGTAAYAASGHAYWSPDVAQHHHYRGQGRVDQERVRQQQEELELLAAMIEDLNTFE